VDIQDFRQDLKKHSVRASFGPWLPDHPRSSCHGDAFLRSWSSGVWFFRVLGILAAGVDPSAESIPRFN
jgi:hypothetical protein